jgi:hypothetical protein
MSIFRRFSAALIFCSTFLSRKKWKGKSEASLQLNTPKFNTNTDYNESKNILPDSSDSE